MSDGETLPMANFRKYLLLRTRAANLLVLLQRVFGRCTSCRSILKYSTVTKALSGILVYCHYSIPVVGYNRLLAGTFVFRARSLLMIPLKILRKPSINAEFMVTIMFKNSASCFITQKRIPPRSSCCSSSSHMTRNSITSDFFCAMFRWLACSFHLTLFAC